MLLCVCVNSVHTCTLYAVSLIPVSCHIKLHKPICVLHITVLYKTELKPATKEGSIFQTANRIAWYNDMSIRNVISGFHHEVDKTFAFLGRYTASSGNSLLIFQDNQSIPSSRQYQSVVLSYENVIIYDKI